MGIADILAMEKHKLAISSVSLGWHDNHTLFDKANAAAENGFQGLELVMGDLEKAAIDAGQTLEDHAVRFKAHCDGMDLAIISVAALENWEGSQTSLSLRMRKAIEWIRIARIVGAPILQVPASFEDVSLLVSEDEIVHQLRLLADCGLPRFGSDESTVEIAYEPMAWSVRSDTWQHALHIKRRVGRPNFKLCLDTYHILAKLWGDCSSPDGKIPGGDAAVERSLFETLRLMKAEDVSFVQLSDAALAQPPVTLAQLREAGKQPSWYWCSKGRCFPYQKSLGAYLPMTDIIRTWLIELGWSGWVSMEIFHSSMVQQDRGPGFWAFHGRKSWDKIKVEMAKEVRPSHL